MQGPNAIRAARRGAPLLAGLLVAAAAWPADPPQKTMVKTPVETVVLDFAASDDGGPNVGNFDNVAFTLDRAPRSIALRNGQRRADAVSSYDYAACRRGQEAVLARSVADLARGTPMFVDYVDVELGAEPHGTSRAGGVCYGWRGSDGAWQWHLASTPLPFARDHGPRRVRLWIKQPGIDALKLVFDASLHHQHLRRVTVGTGAPAATK